MLVGSHSIGKATFSRVLWRASVVVALLTSSFDSSGATLKQETIAEWEAYLQAAEADLQDRVRPGGNFLWTFEDAERARKVHAGNIVVAPASGQSPKKVRGGLVHHWKGAMFVRGGNIDDLVGVTRDYDRYKEFYAPSVVASKLVASYGDEDMFSMVIVNKSQFLHSALEADYQVKNIRLDDHRFYAVSRTTRVQEVEAYGHPTEHRIAEGEGGGYIWKLYGVSRLEQRDGGVYVEFEAIALSREIPAAVRLVASPIVRRVGRNALLISLQQTEGALRGGATVAKSSGSLTVSTVGQP